MAESKSGSEPSPPSHLTPFIGLLSSAGYVITDPTDSLDSDKLFAGLAWCISSANSSDFTRNIETVEDIEEALQLMGCPYVVQASQIQNLDYVGIFPAVQWLVSLVKAAQRESGYVNEKKVAILNELRFLKERSKEAGIDSVVQELVSLLKTSKDLERRGYDLQSKYMKEHSGLLSEINELEENLSDGTDDKDHVYIDYLLSDLSMKLESAKKELASKMRESISLKRQLDDLPIQEEVVQYEQRFSELNVHIQDRLHRTRKYYATYNVLLEIKDLMLKEISILNSLDSQFQEAIENAAGPIKLIHSMEAILKGTQKKLEKVEPGLQVEQKAFDTLRESYIVAIANQRRSSALLKGFQEECKRNQRLKEECAKNQKVDQEFVKSERLRGETSS